MMSRKFFLLSAILAGIAIAGVASPARAQFQLEYSINNGAFTVINGTGSGTVASPYSAVAIVGSLTIVATGSGTTTQPFSSLDLSIGGSEAANTKIQVLVSMAGVITAPPPETLTTAMGNGLDTGSVGQTPGATITMGDYLAQNNVLFNTSTPIVGPQVISPSTTIHNTAQVSLTPLYSWTLATTLDNSANAYSTNNLSTDNNGTLTTPAPAGLVLLASGAPVLAGTWWRRRKAQRAS